MATQYIWYELTKDDCSSQELDEAAAEMRILVNTLFPLLSGQQKLNLGLGSSLQAFFALAPDDNPHLPQDESHSIIPLVNMGNV